MRRRRRALAATSVVVLLGLIASSAALAASPRQIYADFSDNGQLDATYSESDLRATLQSATLGGYEDSGTVGRMNAEIKRQLGAGGPAGAQESLRATGSGGTLPFTGFDLALIVGGAMFLLVVGGGLRKVSRSRA